MELKAVNEYKAPEYSTYNEGRNKVLRFIMNCKKVSVGVLVMLLFCNTVTAVTPFVVDDVELVGSVTEYTPVQIVHIFSMFFKCGIGIIISTILIYLIILIVNIKKSDDEEIKNKYRKKRNGTFIGLGILIAMLLGIEILECFIYGGI